MITALLLFGGFIIGAVAVELDLRRNLKKDSSVVPMIFGKDIILEETISFTKKEI